MTGPLSDQHPDEIAALLARLDAVPSVGHLDSADLGWVRPVLHDLLDEIRRLRGENEQLADLDAAAGRRTELQAERDRAVARWHEEHQRAEKAERECEELRARIGNARREIARQDTAAQLAPHDAAIVGDALAAVETHLVDAEYRPASGPAGEGSAA